MKVFNLLAQDMVIPELNAQGRDEVLKEMVDFLKNKDRTLKAKELLGKLIQRENLGSTAIGAGVAVPHCKMKGVKSPIVLLAVSKKGVDFLSGDDKPSHIFFIVVSSPENPSLNLQILAAIAHLVRKSKGLLKSILGAKNIREMLDIIHEEEEKPDE